MSIRSSYSWRLGMLVKVLPVQPTTRDRSSDVVTLPPPTLKIAAEARSRGSIGGESMTPGGAARSSASATWNGLRFRSEEMTKTAPPTTKRTKTPRNTQPAIGTL